MRVLNKKYWPHQVKLTKEVGYTGPIDVWCYRNLKSENWRCFGKNPVTYAFKRQEDAVLFALKWT